LILSDSLSIKRFHLVAKRARGLLLKFQRRPRPNHSRHLKSSNADPPNQPWRTFFGGKIKVEALEKGVPPRHDSHCLSRALAPSDA
jgi:hypothetical protein